MKSFYRNSNDLKKGTGKCLFISSKIGSVLIGAAFFMGLAATPTVFAEDAAAKVSRDVVVQKSAPVQTKKEKQKEATDKENFPMEAGKKVVSSLGAGLKATDKFILTPIENLKDETNERLGGDVVLLSSDESLDDERVGPRLKVNF